MFSQCDKCCHMNRMLNFRLFWKMSFSSNICFPSEQTYNVTHLRIFFSCEFDFYGFISNDKDLINIAKAIVYWNELQDIDIYRKSTHKKKRMRKKHLNSLNK